MLSWRSRLVIFLLKNRHIFQFRLRPTKIDWTKKESILHFREECEQGAKRFGKIPNGIKIEPITIDTITAEWIVPSGANREKVIMFIHGGGFVSGSCSDHRIHVSKFVKGTNVRALLFEYKLAPEHHFPAALEDTLKTYRWLLDQGLRPSNIVFAGDSAGGGLCLAALLAIRGQGLPLPRAAVALSPWTDLRCTGKSYEVNAKKCLSPNGTWTAFSKHYCGDNDPGLPWISPLYGDLHDLPPILIYVGADEILLDDSINFARKAKDAGVDITLNIGEGMFHCYPVCAPLFPEATKAMEEICTFIKNVL